MTIDIAASSLRPAPPAPPVRPALVLATDLDGTFLAGDADDRWQLYQTVARREDVALIYVTGRGLESVLPLLADPTLPRPRYIVCDVGATVVDGETLQAVQPLQGAIDAVWPGEQAILRAVAGHPGLQRQDVPQQRRCSYFCDADAIDAALHARVEALGCELLYSADRYLDVLPRGVDKGRTLRALVDHLGVDPERVLVAGDTLNDLSMYRAGFNGVCVGASEPALIEATRGHDHVLHAGRAGCGGILEAIDHFDLLDAAALAVDGGDAPAGQAGLVIVYHRLPYEEALVDGRIVRRPHRSPNGIIPTLLSFFGEGRAGSWVAWTDQDPAHPDYRRHPAIDAQRYPRLRAALVPLARAEVDVFYRRFSKEAFWPLLHTFWERARFREDHWQTFLKVNRAFAEAAAAEAAPDATVWVHDYNLWMVPSVLRELRPDVKIAFFHHTQFPSADIFAILPWRREILGSLLACDYVGFHIPRHAENFTDAVRSTFPVEVTARASCAPRFLTFGCAVGVEDMATELRIDGRTVRIGAHPIGTDVGRIRDCLETEQVEEDIARIRDEIGRRKLVLSIERLDYTKGILQKLHAFERLLDASPELRGEVTLVLVCVPAAKEMTVYRPLQQQIEQAVGRINGRLSQLDWTPVRFFSRVLPFADVVAHYAAADVMWITPLRDGLNLVAKEFVAVQGLEGGDGVLVLSEFAGAAAELKGAVLTNPHDPADMARMLRQALAMTPGEREDRQRRLFDIVRHHDLSRWGREFLAAARGGQSGAATEPRTAIAA